MFFFSFRPLALVRLFQLSEQGERLFLAARLSIFLLCRVRDPLRKTPPHSSIQFSILRRVAFIFLASSAVRFSMRDDLIS